MGRLLFLLLLVILGYTLFTALGRMLSGGGRRPPPEKTPHGEDMVRDPVCGTFIAKSDAVELSRGGKNFFFCSRKCRDDFRRKSAPS